MGNLRVMGKEGDVKVAWNVGIQQEIDNARERFVDLKNRGYLAFAKYPGDPTGVVVEEFDPSLEEIIMAPPMVGG